MNVIGHYNPSGIRVKGFISTFLIILPQIKESLVVACQSWDGDRCPGKGALLLPSRYIENRLSVKKINEKPNN